MHWKGGFVSGKKQIGVNERGMASVKDSSISIEPFNDRDDFTSWQQQVKSLLTLEGTIKALKVKTRMTEKMTDDEWMAMRRNDKSEKCQRRSRRI